MDHLDKIQQNMVNLEYPIAQFHLQKSTYLFRQQRQHYYTFQTIARKICKDLSEQLKSLAINSGIHI